MLTKSCLLFVALLVAAALPGPCFAGPVVAFQYSLPAPPGSGFLTISASGTLFTGDPDPVSGGYLVIGITGTRTVETLGTSTITGLIPPNGFEGNQNLLYLPGPPLLDFAGLSFTVSSADGSDDGLGNVNIYYSPGFGFYNEAGPLGFGGTFEAAPIDAAGVPEPSNGGVLLMIAAGLLSCRQWYRIKSLL